MCITYIHVYPAKIISKVTQAIKARIYERGGFKIIAASNVYGRTLRSPAGKSRVNCKAHNITCMKNVGHKTCKSSWCIRINVIFILPVYGTLNKNSYGLNRRAKS